MPNQALDAIKQAYLSILGDNLVGIYLHGSLAFGCFNKKKSDIDFIVVVNTLPTLKEKIELIEVLLKLREESNFKKYEMSVVLKSNCLNFIYPTPYALHYSDSYLEAIKKDIKNYCENMHGLDYDLAAHFTIIKYKGYPLYGEAIEQAFGVVDEKYYFDSILRDVSSCVEDIIIHPIYMILNLCRVLAYKRDRLILSKAEGGAWGIKYKSKYKNLIQSALDSYLYNKEDCFDELLLKDFAEEMLKEIEESGNEDVRCNFK